MLKQISILVIGVAACFTSCSTQRFADVVPETEGTPLGEVNIGVENQDYFVVPTSRSFATGYDETPETVVVFKTKERHPAYRTAQFAGAPIRTVNEAASAVLGGVTDLAGAVVTEPFQEREPVPVIDPNRGVSPVSPSLRSPDLAPPTSPGAVRDNAIYQLRNPIAYPSRNPVRNPMQFNPFNH